MYVAHVTGIRGDRGNGGGVCATTVASAIIEPCHQLLDLETHADPVIGKSTSYVTRSAATAV